jgi:hypothetical protein
MNCGSSNSSSTTAAKKPQSTGALSARTQHDHAWWLSVTTQQRPSPSQLHHQAGLSTALLLIVPHNHCQPVALS